jgi:hypothetical protein
VPRSLTLMPLLRWFCRAPHHRPDAGPRLEKGRTSPILRMDRMPTEKVLESWNWVTWVRTNLFQQTPVWWWHKESPPARHSIRAAPDALRRLLALRDILCRRAILVANKHSEVVGRPSIAEDDAPDPLGRWSPLEVERHKPSYRIGAPLDANGYRSFS